MGFDKILDWPFIIKSKFLKNKKFKISVSGNPSCMGFVIINGWLMTANFSRHLVKQAKQLGRVINVELPESIFTGNPKETVEMFDFIQSVIEEEMKLLNAKNYVFIGASLGNVLATRLANKYKNTKLFVMAVPGANLAHALWNGHETQIIKRKYQKNGITLKKLDKEWKTLHPENNISNMKGKKTHLYYSKADEIIPGIEAEKIFRLLKRKKAKVEVKENRTLGHCLTLVKDYFFHDLKDDI